MAATPSIAKSAERAMDLLETLGTSPRPLSAMVLARRCGIPKSSTYHVLAALRRRGFVRYDELTRLWSLGSRLADIATDAPTVAQTFGVLDAFDAGESTLSPVQLAQRTGLEVSLVTHSIELLLAQNLLTEHDDGSYSLGLHIAALAARLPQIERLRTIARPRLVQLRDRSGETANLLIRDGDDVIYLDQIESWHALRHTGWAGRAIPLETSAAGQALIDPTRIHVVLDAVEPGVTAIASALDVALEQPVAISITGPSARLPRPVIDMCEKAIAEAAAAIARDMVAVRPRSG